MTRTPAGEHSVDEQCVAAVAETAKVLEELGCVIEETHPPALDEPPPQPPVWMAEYAARVEEWSERLGYELDGTLEPLVAKVVELAREQSAPQCVLQIQREQMRARRIAAWWEEAEFDLLLTPTMAELPPPIGNLTASPENPLAILPRILPFVAFTLPFNMTGQPAISLPAYWTPNATPVGVQLVAALGREDHLLSVGSALEAVVRWDQRHPSICACKSCHQKTATLVRNEAGRAERQTAPAET